MAVRHWQVAAIQLAISIFRVPSGYVQFACCDVEEVFMALPFFAQRRPPIPFCCNHEGTDGLLPQLSDGTHGPVLMSPLATGCVRDDPFPPSDVLEAMIEAAVCENRSKITIVTDAQRRNEVIMHLLLPNFAKLRDSIPIEILLIDNARDELAWEPGIEEAIITLPDLRSEVIAILSGNKRLNRPWPLLWHDQHLCMISSEYLSGMPAAILFNPRLLV